MSSYTDSEEDAKEKVAARNQPSPPDGTRRPSDPAREYRPQQQKKDNHHHHLSKHLSKKPRPMPCLHTTISDSLELHSYHLDIH